MVTHVKKKDILSFHTKLVKNTPPYTVGKATNIDSIGSIIPVDGDGNCYFMSLCNAEYHSQGKKIQCNKTTYRQNLYNFAHNDWRSIVSRVFSGAEGDAVPYFFQISRKNSNMKLKLTDLNKESNGNVNDFHEWYEDDVLKRIWDVNQPQYDYNSGSPHFQWGYSRNHTPIMSLYYKKTFVCIYPAKTAILAHQFGYTTKHSKQPLIGIIMVLYLHRLTTVF